MIGGKPPRAKSALVELTGQCPEPKSALVELTGQCPEPKSALVELTGQCPEPKSALVKLKSTAIPRPWRKSKQNHPLEKSRGFLCLRLSDKAENYPNGCNPHK